MPYHSSDVLEIVTYLYFSDIGNFSVCKFPIYWNFRHWNSDKLEIVINANSDALEFHHIEIPSV